MSKQVVKLQTLEFVKRIVCRFGAFDASSTGTREFLNRVTSKKLKETNRKCEIKHQILHDGSPTRVEFAFDDGSEHTLKSGGMSIRQITQRMNQKRGQIVLLEQLKLNPDKIDFMKEVEGHFKDLEETVGFDNVLFEVPYKRGLGSFNVEPVTDEEAEKYNLAERFAQQAREDPE